MSDFDETALCLVVPCRIVSNANQREHWSKRHRRNKQQRAIVLSHLLSTGMHHAPALPTTVTLTRIAPRRLDDDNNVSGFKAVRDCIAEWLGIDDGSDLIAWRYDQQRGRPKEYACRVEIAWGEQ